MGRPVQFTQAVSFGRGRLDGRALDLVHAGEASGRRTSGDRLALSDSIVRIGPASAAWVPSVVACRRWRCSTRCRSLERMARRRRVGCRTTVVDCPPSVERRARRRGMVAVTVRRSCPRLRTAVVAGDALPSGGRARIHLADDGRRAAVARSLTTVDVGSVRRLLGTTTSPSNSRPSTCSPMTRQTSATRRSDPGRGEHLFDNMAGWHVGRSLTT